ncbi:MAG: hypothetical protein QMC67_03270 [Candidatus Wallbacteria bacterium]
MILDRFLTTAKYLTAFAIVGSMFYAGCSSGSNITHEAAGVIIPSVSPYTITKTSAETSESEIIKTGVFSNLTINFQNLNAIPVTITKYKVDYIDNYTGEKVSDLTFGADTVFTISGSAAVSNSSTSSTTSGSTGGGASTTGTSTTSTTGSGTSSSSTNSLNFGIVNQKVKNALYRNVNDPLDNRMLNAKITFYGNDYNGNGLELNASVTILP